MLHMFTLRLVVVFAAFNHLLMASRSSKPTDAKTPKDEELQDEELEDEALELAEDGGELVVDAEKPQKKDPGEPSLAEVDQDSAKRMTQLGLTNWSNYKVTELKQLGLTTGTNLAELAKVDGTFAETFPHSFSRVAVNADGTFAEIEVSESAPRSFSKVAVNTDGVVVAQVSAAPTGHSLLEVKDNGTAAMTDVCDPVFFHPGDLLGTKDAGSEVIECFNKKLAPEPWIMDEWTKQAAEHIVPPLSHGFDELLKSGTSEEQSKQFTALRDSAICSALSGFIDRKAALHSPDFANELEVTFTDKRDKCQDAEDQEESPEVKGPTFTTFNHTVDLAEPSGMIQYASQARGASVNQGGQAKGQENNVIVPIDSKSATGNDKWFVFKDSVDEEQYLMVDIGQSRTLSVVGAVIKTPKSDGSCERPGRCTGTKFEVRGSKVTPPTGDTGILLGHAGPDALKQGNGGASLVEFMLGGANVRYLRFSFGS